jgi:hypothetical protein
MKPAFTALLTFLLSTSLVVAEIVSDEFDVTEEDYDYVIVGGRSRRFVF